ncbi:hypothetical protein C6P40_004728 [Pichia californica]|uniref:NADP-dependent oxidoreductase domain-containing protein n=1 Tax=Pichia californica TaxID=460514 RepID=A0A9P6WPY9_9ASCO|nr:hypothetical protein C6P42_004102 [[Candida] californica]KAG0691122.1 hypothetical protein C6P40_004728 [[Candida] californica]
MKYVNLGNSGLKISQLVVGCMSFGKKTEYGNWVLEDEEKIMEILKYCYDIGLRTFDTADMYSNGISENLIGKFLVKYNIPRYTVVILSKCYFPVDSNTPGFVVDGIANKDPNNMKFINSQGLSRKHIFDAVTASTERLGTYIDVLQIHRFDKSTPIEETMRALNDIIISGKVRYIGASSMRATQFAQMQFVAEKNGWYKFISMQNFYNLLYREEEREMIPFCNDTGVGLLHWSPLARGILTRPPQSSNDSERLKSDMAMSYITKDYSTCDEEIISRVEEIAKKLDCKMSQVATAWVISKGGCPILGLSNIERVKEAVSSLDIQLTTEQIEYLEGAYKAKDVRGF